MSKKFIITGASGFVGKALTQWLLENGDFVYAVVRDASKMKDLLNYQDLKIIEMPMNKYKNLFQYINEPVDVLFHLAWNGYKTSADDPNIQFENVTYSIDLLQSAAKIGVEKFIFTGTSHEFLKKNIDSDIRLCSVYGAAKSSFKQIGRILSQRYNMKFNSTIFSNVFGVGDYSKRSAYIIIKKFLDNEKPYIINSSRLYDWTYIDDAISGLLKVSESDYNCKDYYIGSNELRVFKDIINDVKLALSSDTEVNFDNRDNQYEYIDYDMIDLKLLNRDTGFIVSSNFIESVRKTASWIKKNNI